MDYALAVATAFARVKATSVNNQIAAVFIDNAGVILPAEAFTGPLNMSLDHATFALDNLAKAGVIAREKIDGIWHYEVL